MEIDVPAPRRPKAPQVPSVANPKARAAVCIPNCRAPIISASRSKAREAVRILLAFEVDVDTEGICWLEEVFPAAERGS